MDVQRIEFEGRLPIYQALLDEAQFILNDAIDDASIKIHQIEHRLKTWQSLSTKLLSREDIRHFSEISDIVGLRIICLFRTDMLPIDKLIRANFSVVSVDEKFHDSPDTFGYMSTHYICQMRSDYTGPRYRRIATLQLEIQVRTLCMHAWAAVSHYIDYKGDWDVPAELKKALNALSGLFYVADDEFEQVSKARETSRAAAEKSASQKQLGRQEINLDTLAAYLRSKFSSRHPYSGPDISSFVQEVKSAGYRTIEELSVDIDKAHRALVEYERHRRSRFSDLGAARISLGLSSPGYRSVKYPGDPDFEKYQKYIQ